MSRPKLCAEQHDVGHFSAAELRQALISWNKHTACDDFVSVDVGARTVHCLSALTRYLFGHLAKNMQRGSLLEGNHFSAMFVVDKLAETNGMSGSSEGPKLGVRIMCMILLLVTSILFSTRG